MALQIELPKMGILVTEKPIIIGQITCLNNKFYVDVHKYFRLFTDLESMVPDLNGKGEQRIRVTQKGICLDLDQVKALYEKLKGLIEKLEQLSDM